MWLAGVGKIYFSVDEASIRTKYINRFIQSFYNDYPVLEGTQC